MAGKSKFIIKAIRDGESKGGMACGPIPGSDNIEIIFTDNKGRLRFVDGYNFEGVIAVKISDNPLIEFLNFADDMDIDDDYLLRKAMNKMSEGNSLDFEDGYMSKKDFDELLKPKRQYRKLFLLAISLLQGHLKKNKAIKEYVGNDIMTMADPEIETEEEEE